LVAHQGRPGDRRTQPYGCIFTRRNRGRFSKRGCLSALPPSASGTFEVTWDTGEKSTVTGTSTSQDVAGQTVLTLTGVVVSGPFVGASFTEVLVQSNLDLLGCLAPPGVQSQSGLGTLAVV
jgi:hypothetical protein